MKQLLSRLQITGISTFSLFTSALAVGLPIAVLGIQTPSTALCAVDHMGGRWENVDENTRGITTINYFPRCGDQILCDTDGNCSTPPRTTIQVLGSCHPTDYDWGEEDVEFRREDNWRYSVYDQGFARKVVWLRLESSGQLTVVEQVDYRDDRTDRTSWYVFEKS